MWGHKITEFNIRLEMPQTPSNSLDKCNPETGQQIIITECQKAYDDNNKFQIMLDFQNMNIMIIST
jgi:hypothetical protein